jgi:hypothetical protein
LAVDGVGLLGWNELDAGTALRLDASQVLSIATNNQTNKRRLNRDCVAVAGRGARSRRARAATSARAGREVSSSTTRTRRVGSVAIVVATVSAIGVASLVTVRVEVAAEVVATRRRARARSRLLVGRSASKTRVATRGLVVNLLLRRAIIVRDAAVCSDALGLCDGFGDAYRAGVNGTNCAQVDAARA